MTLQDIAKEVAGIAGTLFAARLAIGERVSKMLTMASMAVVVATLKEAIPSAKQVIGYEITDTLLKNFVKAYEAFSKDGGIVSPDGHHTLTAEEAEPLRLSPEQTATLVDAIRQGIVKVKRVKKLAKKAAKGDVKEAQAQLLSDIQVDAEPAEESVFTLENALAEAIKQRASAETRLANAERKVNELQAQLAAKRAEQAATPTPQDSSATAKARRRTSKAERTAVAAA